MADDGSSDSTSALRLLATMGVDNVVIVHHFLRRVIYFLRVVVNKLIYNLDKGWATKSCLTHMDWQKVVLPASLVAAYLLFYRLVEKPHPVEVEEESDLPNDNHVEEEVVIVEDETEEEEESVEITEEDILKYVLLAEECEPQLTTSLQKQYFAKLEKEYKRIKRALEQCAASGTSEHVSYALRIIGSMYRFWFVTGRQHEGYNIAKVFFDSYINPSECNNINAKFFEAFGFLAHAKGDFDEAEEHLTVALSYHSTLGNDFSNATVANQLGNCARERGEYNRAASLHQTALEIFTGLNSPWGIALSQNNLGVVAREKGEWDKAKKFFEDSLATRKQIEDEIGIASSYGNIATVAFAQGDYTKAAEYHTNCLNIRRKLNDVWGIAGATSNLGLVAAERSEFEKSRESLSAAIKSFSKLRDKLGMCEALEGFACLAAKEKKWHRAAVLFGAAKELRGSIRAHVPFSRKGHYDKHVTEISSQLSPLVQEQLEKQGAAMDFTQAVTYVLN
eukprot:Phypoly_transcript_03615.p1 GENE.Phypoly_transcript_03615~~Phypoly_transcript_03615.p1  ORF type:complete len:506 (-),score=93.04 Phypoly_transcript_03615:183-1700(-)